MRRLPLTPLQTSLVLASVRSPESGSYILQDILELPEEVNAAALKRRGIGWRRAIRSCARASEGTGEGVLWQHVHESPETHWRELDCSQPFRGGAGAKSDGGAGTGLETGIRLRSRASLALPSDPPTPQHSYRLVNGISPRSARRTIRAARWRAMVHDLRSPPRGQRTRPLLARPFQDYADWIRQQDLEPAKHSPRGELTGLAGTTGFIQEQFRPPAAFRPRARDPPFLQAGTSRREDPTHRLTSVARNCGGTLNMVAVGAWALLLNRYSGANEVVFGVTHTARPRPVGPANRRWPVPISARFPCSFLSISELPRRSGCDSWPNSGEGSGRIAGPPPNGSANGAGWRGESCPSIAWSFTTLTPPRTGCNRAQAPGPGGSCAASSGPMFR